jgi:peroxiredoxin
MPIANFTLADQTGASHELYASKDARAVVLIMQGVGCPIVQKMTPDLKKVLADFDGKGVEFMMVNSNMQDTPAMIADEATKFDIKLPILKDADQKVGKDIHAVRTAEVFVVDPKTWTIVYHGPLNDRLTYGREKAVAENNYVSDVLTAVLAGQTPPAIKQEADGCIINFT